MNPAFFLDRDGTLNVDYNFVHTPEEWTWCTGAVEAIRWMNDQGLKVIVVTNQSGIVRNRFSHQQVDRLHQWVDEQLGLYDAHIDDWFVAPWHPEHAAANSPYDPNDRKPGTGMFVKAAEKHTIDFEQSFMAGDKISDLKPAIELGMQPFFIRSRHEENQDPEWLNDHQISTYQNIGEVMDECMQPVG